MNRESNMYTYSNLLLELFNGKWFFLKHQRILGNRDTPLVLSHAWNEKYRISILLQICSDVTYARSFTYKCRFAYLVKLIDFTLNVDHFFALLREVLSILFINVSHSEGTGMLREPYDHEKLEVNGEPEISNAVYHRRVGIIWLVIVLKPRNLGANHLVRGLRERR